MNKGKKLLAVLALLLGSIALEACKSMNETTTDADAVSASSVNVQMSTGSGQSGTYNEFINWIQGENATAAVRAAFLPGRENRPTDEELIKMFTVANTYLECHGLGAAHFVVIKDENKQADILKFMPLEVSGTVTVLVLADGIKDQEHHAARYYPGTRAVNGGNPEYWTMHLGIYEAGWASGYLNLAAASLGYRTRAFAALNLYAPDLNQTSPYITGGNWEVIRKNNWEISEFTTSKDGSKRFDHYVPALRNTIPLEGNLTLLCAIVIGSINEVDAVTSVSHFNDKLTNYDFWD
jgi:hypothetical protein